jgi:hypothetical protein
VCTLRGVHSPDTCSTCVYIHMCVYMCVYKHTHGHIRQMKVVRVCIDRFLTPAAPAQACLLRRSAAASLDGLRRAAARPVRAAPLRYEHGPKHEKGAQPLPPCAMRRGAPLPPPRNAHVRVRRGTEHTGGAAARVLRQGICGCAPFSCFAPRCRPRKEVAADHPRKQTFKKLQQL